MIKAKAIPVVATPTTIAVSIKTWGNGFRYSAALIISCSALCPSPFKIGRVPPFFTEVEIKYKIYV